MHHGRGCDAGWRGAVDGRELLQECKSAGIWASQSASECSATLRVAVVALWSCGAVGYWGPSTFGRRSVDCIVAVVVACCIRGLKQHNNTTLCHSHRYNAWLDPTTQLWRIVMQLRCIMLYIMCIAMP